MHNSTPSQRINRALKPAPVVEQLRGVACVAGEFPVLARYMGESRFNAAAMAFLLQRPDRISEQRIWLRRFPAHLQNAEPFSFFPELAELAELELRFHLALEADDHRVSVMNAEAKTDGKVLRLHPSVQFVAFEQNTTSLWAALQCDEMPPRPFRLDASQQVVVWRQGSTVRFRMLGDEEAAALAAFNGRRATASPYFRSWAEAGLVVAAVK